MSCFSGPITNIATTGNLILSFDATNPKSLTYTPATNDHGISDWYCFASGTATYSIITANVSIYQNQGGVITTMVAGTTSPQRGTITVTQGCTYYGNGPIFLLVEDQQHSIIPTSLAGTRFIHFMNRNDPGYLYIYSPYTTSLISFFNGTAAGINSTATYTVTITKGDCITILAPTLTWVWITATNPVIASTTQTGADKTVLVPASSYIYNRYIGAYNTTINSTATSIIGTYVVYDTTYPIMNVTIADGSGGDSCQGLGYQHLCDTYSWGNACSDYVIVAPYNVTVTASYWSGSAWVVWETHVLTGTQTSPGAVLRDGTNGVGITATIISGAAADMASGATLWKWEGTNPFYICINDTVDDEFSMMGWMAAKTQRTSADYTSWYDPIGTATTGTLINGPTYNSSNKGSIVFDGVNDYVTATASNTSGQALSIVGWLYSTETTATYRNFFDCKTTNPMSWWAPETTSPYSNIFDSGISNPMIWWNNSGQIDFDSGLYTTTTVYSNQWVQVALSKPSGNTSASYYVNGALVGTGTAYTISVSVLSWFNRSAGQTWLGQCSQFQLYNKALSAAEITQKFNATRGRYGI